MKHKGAWKTYAFWILLTEGVGALSGFLTREGTELYKTMIEKPALSPPAIVFPIVWSILYLLMAVAVARVRLSRPSPAREQGTLLYVLQLAFNFCWSIYFFNLFAFGFALAWLVVMELLIVLTAIQFRKVDKPAFWLLVPYIAWVAFAGYLNAGVWLLN